MKSCVSFLATLFVANTTMEAMFKRIDLQKSCNGEVQGFEFESRINHDDAIIDLIIK